MSSCSLIAEASAATDCLTTSPYAETTASAADFASAALEPLTATEITLLLLADALAETCAKNQPGVSSSGGFSALARTEARAARFALVNTASWSAT